MCRLSWFHFQEADKDMFSLPVCHCYRRQCGSDGSVARMYCNNLFWTAVLTCQGLQQSMPSCWGAKSASSSPSACSATVWRPWTWRPWSPSSSGRSGFVCPFASSVSLGLLTQLSTCRCFVLCEELIQFADPQALHCSLGGTRLEDSRALLAVYPCCLLFFLLSWITLLS